MIVVLLAHLDELSKFMGNDSTTPYVQCTEILWVKSHNDIRPGSNGVAQWGCPLHLSLDHHYMTQK